MEYKKDDVGLLLKRIHDAMEKHYNAHLKTHDLTMSQGRILGYLRKYRDTIISQKDLEVYFQVSHPTMVGLVQRLEQKGFIETRFDHTDKRVKNIYLTEKEAALYHSLEIGRIEADAVLLHGLTSEEVHQLQVLLSKLHQNMNNQ